MNLKIPVYLKLYRDAVNDIDDYFEYRCHSKLDQEYVHEVLASLTEKLQQVDADSKV